MVVFHFGNTMEGIKALAHATPSLSSVVDRETLRSATKLFSQHFRHCESARHAIAHSGELKVNPASWNENAARVASLEKSEKSGLQIGGRIIRHGGLVWVEDYFVDRTLHNTYNGHVISFEISEDTVQKLTEVRDEFYRSFPTPAV
jgi:hypothetical protein